MIGTRRLAKVLASAMFMGLGGLVWSQTSAGTRDALWQVVQGCVANYRITGAAFPCLQVNLAEGEAGGFVLLRRPFGKNDTVLVPTRRIVGLEDPSLLDPHTKNYIDAAWRAGSLETRASTGRLALAVNSRLSRSQDQFHIHIGCLTPYVRDRLDREANHLTQGSWRRLSVAAGNAVTWGILIPGPDLSAVNPIELLAQGLLKGEGRDAMEQTTFAITQTGANAGGSRMMAIAWRMNPLTGGAGRTAEDLLDGACS